MSNPPNQFAAVFLQEATEQLALIEEIILEIESHPDDTEALNRLFRVFHTIKGSGAMFGFDEVAEFTHHIETVLDKVRSRTVPISRELVDVILVGKDHISLLLKNESPEPEAAQKIIARLAALMPGAEAQPVTPVNPAADQSASASMKTFQVRFRPEPAILARGINPADLLADLRKLGTCTIVARTDAVAPLEQSTPDVCGFTWDITLTTDQGIDAIKDVFIFVEDSEIIIEPLAATPSAEPAAPAAVPEATKPSTEIKTDPKNAGSRKTAGIDSSVRVPSKRLDRLVNLVGELVINQSRLAQISSRLENGGLSASTEDLERLVGELRNIVLGIRMMPIGTTFSRFKRLVRDLSAELGKEIDLVTEGEGTELDKTVLDQLADPLVHLIRNSIDHGIGTPEERLQEGKPRRGTVRLAARYEGANVILTIEDDGRGLDKEMIRAKAIEKNLIAADKDLSEAELFNLIFLPGFSTAKAVTNVSGRGVGMDVVKRQIDALRGAVELSSQPGKGTCVTLTLPLTLAIIDGLLVEVEQEQFIIPMSSVRENVELTAAQRATANGRNLTAVRGELIPYLRLRKVFEIEGKELDVERVVIVSVGASRLGLVVDRVIGSHQTVIQSLGWLYEEVQVFSGATIMGDGRVALILDVSGLLRYTDEGETQTVNKTTT